MAPRFAITASDRFLGVLEAFIEAGWEPVKLFTGRTDNRIHHNQCVIERAEQLAIPVHFSRMTEDDLAGLQKMGCEALIVASYAWKIGNWAPYLKYAVNFHPSPLPIGRGPYPYVPAILNEHSSWGVTCHRLNAAFDEGEILDQEAFQLDGDETHESLNLKTQLASRRLAKRVASQFDHLWQSARPQAGGSYYPHWTPADRRLDFTQPVATILRKIRAFGLIETIAFVNGVEFFVRHAVGWQASHQERPGGVSHIDNLSMVVAVPDGYIGILEWSLLDPDARTGKIGR